MEAASSRLYRSFVLYALVAVLTTGNLFASIKIGVILPETGRFARLSYLMRTALELPIESPEQKELHSLLFLTSQLLLHISYLF